MAVERLGIYKSKIMIKRKRHHIHFMVPFHKERRVTAYALLYATGRVFASNSRV